MDRINVIGAPGSGKSFLSDAIGKALRLPVVRIDGLRHGPGWVEVPEEQFEARVAAAAAGDRWVMDGSYPTVRPTIWQWADAVVWADLDKSIVMRQVVSRSLRDWASGRERLPGCRERLANFLQPWHPIRWAWKHHAAFRAREQAWLAEARWSHLEAIRLRSRREIDAFIAAIGERGVSG